jgi:hypothetical protein
MSALRIVCAWCGRCLCAGAPGAATSHTACAACAERLLNDWQQQKGRVA